jgi:hypothetical protein
MSTVSSDNFGPLPLIVGVTGHRDLAGDEAAIATAIRSCLVALRRAAPSTEIWILSALAEGADQLAAQAALDCGAPLAAVLPAPIDDYEKTIETAEGRSALRRLWSAAATQLELPFISDGSEGRSWEAQYEQAGLLIARQSHVVLAIWNGQPAVDAIGAAEAGESGRGGTADVVRLRLRGDETGVATASPLFTRRGALLDPIPDGLTLRIATARRSDPQCIGAPGSLWLLDPTGESRPIDEAELAKVAGERRRKGDDADPENHGVFADIDAANALLRDVAKNRRDALLAAEEDLLPEKERARLGAQKPAVDRVLNCYAHAELAARKYQHYTHRTIFWLTAALPVAVLAYELYAHVNRSRLLLAAYLGVISLTFALFAWGIRQRQWQSRFQDCRALAEALRIQLFWSLSGIANSVADDWLDKHRREMHWIRQALLGPSLWAMAAGVRPARPELVRACWIDGQRRYFAGEGNRPGKALVNKTSYKRFSVLASASYFIGIGAAVLLLASQSVFEDLSPEFVETIICLMGMAPVIAGALSIFAEKRAFKDHAHSYAHMARLFGRAQSILDTEKSSFRAVVRELGVEALAENGDWLLAHRDREVEPIKGG